MENHTIVQLKAIVKERGIKGYYELRKAELIHDLEATRLVEQKSNIFDEQIPNDPTPILQTTPWRPSNFAKKSKQKIKKNSLLRVYKRLKILVIGCSTTYHQNQKWLTKCLSLLITKLKNCMKREIHFSNQHSPNLL